VELPLRPLRKGDKVRVLPPRGESKKGDQRLWQVHAIHRAKKTAELALLGVEPPETQSAALDDLVVVDEFRDMIYPGLVSTGKVTRGDDKPFHTVINGENYHVLKALTYTHRGKVDAIYIDPPYNTGAKDWKYNNDYVEGDDLYRHSMILPPLDGHPVKRFTIANRGGHHDNEEGGWAEGATRALQRGVQAAGAAEGGEGRCAGGSAGTGPGACAAVCVASEGAAAGSERRGAAIAAVRAGATAA
jgi:hypothetical protein